MKENLFGSIDDDMGSHHGPEGFTVSESTAQPIVAAPANVEFNVPADKGRRTLIGGILATIAGIGLGTNEAVHENRVTHDANQQIKRIFDPAAIDQQAFVETIDSLKAQGRTKDVTDMAKIGINIYRAKLKTSPEVNPDYKTPNNHYYAYNATFEQIREKGLPDTVMKAVDLFIEIKDSLTQQAAEKVRKTVDVSEAMRGKMRSKAQSWAKKVVAGTVATGTMLIVANAGDRLEAKDKEAEAARPPSGPAR